MEEQYVIMSSVKPKNKFILMVTLGLLAGIVTRLG